MPTVRLSNIVPKAQAKGDIPRGTVRIQSTNTVSTAGTTISAGTPIGLLLVLTYANAFIVGASTTSMGERPHARIA